MSGDPKTGRPRPRGEVSAFYSRPENRTRVVDLVTVGCSIARAAEIITESVKDMPNSLGSSYDMLMRELRIDPEFQKRVDLALGNLFEPAVMHAITLAKEADVEGKNRGAHKALAQVMNHYTRVRVARVDAANKGLLGAGDNGKTFARISPAQAAQMFGLPAGAEDLIDVEEIEDAVVVEDDG